MDRKPIDEFRLEVEGKKANTAPGTWPMCIMDLDRKVEVLLAFSAWQDGKITALEEDDAWMKKAKEAFEGGTCPICFAGDEDAHNDGCYILELENLCKEGEQSLGEAADKIDECADGLSLSSEVAGVLHFHLRELRAELQKRDDGLMKPKSERLDEADDWIQKQLEEAGKGRKIHGIPTMLAGPVESVPGTEEPEVVEIPLKFESGFWPVGLDKLLKALRGSFAVNPNDSAYDENLGEALAEFDERTSDALPKEGDQDDGA